MSDDFQGEKVAELLDLRERIARLNPKGLQDRHEIERLRGSLDLFRTIVDTVGTSIVGLYPDHSIFAWNDEAARVFGVSREEVLDQDFLELFIAEPLRPRVAEALDQVLERGEVLGSEYEVLARDGTRRLMMWNIRKVTDKEGNPVGVIACGQDISKRKQAETELLEAKQELESRVAERTAELASAIKDLQAEVSRHEVTEDRLREEQHLSQVFMDNIPDHIFFKDLDSRFIRVNRALLEWMSIENPKDLIGKTDADVFSEEHALQARADEQQVIRTGLPMVSKEEKESWPDGRETWVTTTKLPLFDDQGEIIGTFGISRDVTEQLLAKQELERAAKKLKQNNEEMSEFARVVSHDLQEPLRLLITYCQLLKEQAGLLDPRSQECLDFAVGEAMRMQDLVNDLTSYAQAGQEQQQISLTDCRELVADELRALAQDIEASGARVEVGDLPVFETDRDQVAQVFHHLLSNALKFRSEAPPQIAVDAVREGLAWRFSVRDNGIGMDNGYADKVFSIFERLHARDAHAGTGIGLALCKRIVERHHGRIWFESAEGEGTTVYFTLPAQA